ncbi:MAG: hypothetical protein JW839_05875 [Candidatus Lokiarchaeota archaeon]|nr:hypothetical protein [Candidatus Lokiarchaeota archaeon]
MRSKAKEALVGPAPEAQAQPLEASTKSAPSKAGADPYVVLKDASRAILAKSSMDIHFFDGFVPRVDAKGEFASIVALRRLAMLLCNAASQDILPMISDLGELMGEITQNPMIIPRLLEAVESEREKQRLLELAVKKALVGMVPQEVPASPAGDRDDSPAPSRMVRAEGAPDSLYS